MDVVPANQNNDTVRYSNNRPCHGMPEARRRYQQTARAAATAALRERIVLVFHDLLLVRWIDEVTLDAIAAAAGTTRQSVIRLFGGKDGVLEAVIGQVWAKAAPRITLPPAVAPREALAAVVRHYEEAGDMTFRLLAQEERHPALRPWLEIGRRNHRAWIDQGFAPALAGLGPAERERQVTRLVAATDVYTWKLLRRDFGLGAEEVAGLVAGMVEAIIGGPGT